MTGPMWNRLAGRYVSRQQSKPSSRSARSSNQLVWIELTLPQARIEDNDQFVHLLRRSRPGVADATGCEVCDTALAAPWKGSSETLH